jgi:hypothetical protein
MRLLDLVIKEYISIVEALQEGEAVENNRIVIDKGYFKELLEKYHYMKFGDKTKIYKDLNFILHDKNNYTLPCKDTETKKTVRKVVLNYTAYRTIKKLLETEVTL